MPVHDWSRVSAGIFHDFHHSWIEENKRILNSGLLPPEYYALAEQIAGSLGPDVLALQEVSLDGSQPDSSNGGPPITPSAGPITLATVPPKVRFTAQTEMDGYVRKQSTLVIRHTSGDRIIALVEVVSPGNKASRHALRSFVQKSAEAMYHGYHLLILDLQPPTVRDPNGIHGAIWAEIEDAAYQAPPEKPLTLVAYSSGQIKMAFVEPIAVGDTLPQMPLFLHPGSYINIPLETTYQAAWSTVPRRWQRVLESRA